MFSSSRADFSTTVPDSQQSNRVQKVMLILSLDKLFPEKHPASTCGVRKGSTAMRRAPEGAFEADKNMILYSHPTGNANVRQSLQALCEAELLAEFWTCIEWRPESFIARALPSSLTRQMARRTFPDTSGKTRTMPGRESLRLVAQCVGWTALTRHETGIAAVDAVYRALDQRVAAQLSRLPALKGVYAGEDGARDSFARARERGLKTFYDLPIGYWRAGHAVYDEEREREPQWAATLTGSRDSAAKLERKDQELALADVVFVASSFTQQTLALAPNCKAQVHRVPYGSPLAIADNALVDDGFEERREGKLRVLFVGALSQRKGLSYLLKAVEMLGEHVELTLIGQKPALPCAPLEAALRRHRWIESLPHGEILAAMRRHDVFVLPSLFEGFGLVLLEAMSQGLPVITTSHTAGPDFIETERDGFIVPLRDANAIAEKLTLLLEQPALRTEMRRAAVEKARLQLWQNYRVQLQNIIRDAIA